MSDDNILEQSAQQAMRIAQQAQLDKSERDASSAGLQVSQHQDGVMNEGRSYSGGGAGPGDVMARESEANRMAVEARRAVLAEGELDMSDLLAADLNSRDANEREHARTELRKLQQVTNHIVDTGARQVVQDAYMNPNEASMMMEQEAYRAPSMDGWTVVKKSAQLKSGKSIPVFIVEDALSGMTTGKKYRIGSVAEKVARVLNATNNPSDPRVRMIDEAYDCHVSLMRELAQAKKNGNRNKVSLVESKLQEVNTRLGID